MTNETAVPQGNPGDIINWPMLKLAYRTDPDKVAALLPPGIEPGAEPIVRLTIYNFPVPDEPEYGIVTSVDANFDGVAGEFTLGYGIDQESAIFVSQETNGQPKYPCITDYYRLGPQVSARCTHQGYTFVEYKGVSTGPVDAGPEFEQNEFWLKYSRAVSVGGTDGTDGPTNAAGGIITGATWGDGADLALLKADSGSFLEKANALLTTGPTGTNVMDLVVAIRG